ncbi:MAG: hypothetical protein ACKVZH_01290 [Blastocatellia bacterium]
MILAECYNASVLLDAILEAGRGAKTEIYFCEEQLSYDELLARVCSMGWTLREFGLAREGGGIPLDIIQKYVNYWFTYSLDLFGSEISSNSADFFCGWFERPLRRTKKIRRSHRG